MELIGGPIPAIGIAVAMACVCALSFLMPRPNSPKRIEPLPLDGDLAELGGYQNARRGMSTSKGINRERSIAG